MYPHHASPRYSFLSLGPAYNLPPVVLVSSTYTPTPLLDRIIAESSFSRALFMCDSYLESGRSVDIRRLASEKRRSSLVTIISILFSLPPWPACLLFLPSRSRSIHSVELRVTKDQSFCNASLSYLSLCRPVVLLWPLCHIKNK